MTQKIAVMMDGGFVRYKLRELHQRTILAEDIEKLGRALLAHAKLRQYTMYRIFYYDAKPFTRELSNPISKVPLNYGTTATASYMRNLLDQVELREDFALRQGQLLFQGWKLRGSIEQRLIAHARTLQAEDIEPNFEQKGVDMRIGLDIADIAVKHLVDAILLVTGDSDFVPAMKYARRQGVRVVLFSFDQEVVRDLRAHTDVILNGHDVELKPPHP
ncbi:MAG: NYN domain-containing protein [Candidatus Lambdaproteobacteria bacterium]|nr:NYN domain-containing protein [Candidatus Lambdaproteobacteria bacterium]